MIGLTGFQFHLDEVPPNSGIESDLRFDQGRCFARVRAFRSRLWRRREYSNWSGWFEYEGETLMLTWAAFWDDYHLDAR